MNAMVSLKEQGYKQRLGKLRPFFQTGNVDAVLKGIFLTIARLLPDLDKAHIVIDRTNWSFGGRTYNFLTLGLVYEGCLLPLLWQELGLIRRLLALYLQNRLMPQWHFKADREFINARWLLKWEKLGIYDVIRGKLNAVLSISNLMASYWKICNCPTNTKLIYSWVVWSESMSYPFWLVS